MSSIKLTADSGGGTFEIKTPSSSGNTRVLTLPDTGNLTLNGGKILQVISSTKSDAFSYTANTTAAVDVTGTDQDGNGSVFCVKITPSTTSSKILFTCNFMLGMGGGAAYVQGFMKRGHHYTSTWNSRNWKYGELYFLVEVEQDQHIM